MPLLIDDDTWMLVLTGAGVSAESGIPTFRDAGGLWETHPVEQVASPAGFRKDPELVWRFYAERRAHARACAPNAGHLALAALERRLGDRFLLVTQNVDNLHRRAGSERLVEIHGNLFYTRCSRCDRPPFPDDEAHPPGHVPICGACEQRGERAPLRPHVVWFGELLPAGHLERVYGFMAGASAHRFIFLAAGTSGSVYPAAGWVDDARVLGAETWLVNAQRAENTDAFDRFVQGKSSEALPALLAEGYAGEPRSGSGPSLCRRSARSEELRVTGSSGLGRQASLQAPGQSVI